MAEQNPDDNGERTKERWAFIEEAAEEVKSWPDWKRAEIFPEEVISQREEFEGNADSHPTARFN